MIGEQITGKVIGEQIKYNKGLGGVCLYLSQYQTSQRSVISF